MATNTAASFTNHTGNGSAGPFSISFSYLAESEVDVTVGGVLKTITTHYTFTSPTQITFTSGNEPGNDVAIKFQRDTNISAKKVDFQDGSVLTESDLDTQNDQILFGLQEFTDVVNNDAFLRDGSKTLTGSVVFEGSADDANETTLSVTNPTADRTITLPDTTGTVVTTGDTGTVTSTMISNGTIVNDDINASASIQGTKISPNFGSQTITTSGVIFAGSKFSTDGNIEVDGTVDGRDLQTDGTKLDGIETGATADQTAAEIKTLLNSNGIVNSQINANAAIAGTKISPDFGSQDISTNGTITGNLIASGTTTLANSVTLNGTSPNILFSDTDAVLDYRIQVNNGALKFKGEEATSSGTNFEDKLSINSTNVTVHKDLAVSGSTTLPSLTVSGTTSLATVTATTQSTSDNSTKVATTAFVQGVITTTGVNTKLPLAGGTLTGLLTASDGLTVSSGTTTLANNVTLNGTSPNILFSDTDAVLDYRIQVNNGALKFKGEEATSSGTNFEDKLSINSTNVVVHKDLSVSGTSTLTGNLTVSGNIGSSGTLTLTSGSPDILFVENNFSPNFRVQKDGGDLKIIGETTTASPSTEDKVTIAPESVTVHKDLSVSGTSTLTGNLTVSGTGTLTGLLTASNGLTVSSGTTTLANNAILNGTSPNILFSDTDAVLDYRIQVNSGALKFKGEEATSSGTTFEDKLSINSANVVVHKDLSVSGTGTLTGLLTANNGLTVSGTTTLANSVTLNGTSPNILFSDTDAVLDYRIQVNSGALQFKGEEDTSSGTTFEDKLSINSTNVTVHKDLIVSGFINTTHSTNGYSLFKTEDSGSGLKIASKTATASSTLVFSNNHSGTLANNWFVQGGANGSNYAFTVGKGNIDDTTGTPMLQIGDAVILNYANTVNGTFSTKAQTSSTGFDITGDLKVTGDISSEDKFITLANIATPTDTQAANSGLYIKGSTDKHFRYQNDNNSFNSTENITIAADKKLRFQSKFEIFNSSGLGDDAANFDNTANYSQNDYVKNSDKIYQAQASISAGAGAPTHTNGTVSNWLFVRIDDGEVGQYIKDASTGPLKLLTSTLQVKNVNDNKTAANFIPGGAVNLFHNNVQRLSTTSTGINVNGGITASNGLTVSSGTTTLANSVTLTGSSPSITLTDDGGEPNNPDYKIQVNAGELQVKDETNSVDRLVVDTSGITVTGSVTESSDVALKENIQPLSNVLEKVKQLTGYKYNFKNTTNNSMGVIAQDVEKVFPELVHGEEGKKSLQYSGLIGALIESVKELSAKVAALENQ